MTETWYSKNREKALAQAKAWREANPERSKENVNRWKRENRAKCALHRKKQGWRRYGIALTHEEYSQMEVAQGGVCKICSKPTKSGRKLSVDHCHVTGKVRGLLCAGCNYTLGHIEAYKRSPDRWDNYLKAVESAPVTTPQMFVPAPGYDPLMGPYEYWCQARGIDPKKSWHDDTDSFFE
jgi:hypothetical protein